MVEYYIWFTVTTLAYFWMFTVPKMLAKGRKTSKFKESKLYNFVFFTLLSIFVIVLSPLAFIVLMFGENTFITELVKKV